MPNELFKLALDVGRYLQDRCVDPIIAMEVMAIIQNHDAEITARRRAGDTERQRRSRANRKSRLVTVTECDLPLVPPQTPPYNPSNLEQKNACGSLLPENWEPTPADIEAAREEGLPDEQIEITVRCFRDHYHSKAGPASYSRDWSGTWRNYCRVRVDMLTNSRYAGGRKPKAEKRTETPAKIQRVFVEIDTPQWEAHLKAMGKKSRPTTTHQGKNGWWFDTEWPVSKAA